MNLIINDSSETQTGISVINVASVMSRQNDFIRVCGNLKNNSGNISDAPVRIVAELLDENQRVLDTEFWQPENGRFREFDTFKIVFESVSKTLSWEIIRDLKIYLSFN